MIRKARVVGDNDFFVNLNNSDKGYLDDLKKDINTFNLKHVKLNLFKEAYKSIKT